MSSATPFKKIVRRSNDIGIDRYQAMFQHANPVDVPYTVAVLRQATTQSSIVENQSVVLGCEHLRGGCAVGKPAVSPCAQKMTAMSAGIAVEEIKACKLISAYLLKLLQGELRV